MKAQLVFLILTVVALMSQTRDHGKPKTGIHNLWTSLIATAIQYAILYWGGFFDVILDKLK